MHSNACQCIALPNTALLDCILYMIQAFYQALQLGVFGNVYLRYDLPIKQ